MLSRCGQCHQRLLLALLALLLAPVLCHAGTTTALEDLVLSQLNVTTVAAFGDAIESNPNFTIPTMMDFVAPLKSGVPTVRFQAVATDTYILSQEKLDYIVHVKEQSRLFALGVVLRASAVRGCTAVHAMCCTYYWVTDAYPPGLSLADLDTSLIFWDGHSTNSSVDVAFAKTFDGVDCSEPESLIPNSQKRPVATYTVPMVMTWGSGAEVLRWDFMGTLTYGYARYFEMHSTYNSGNATLNEKILDPIVARLFEPFGDPWSLLGEEAMAFRPTVGSENVTSTRSNAFGYIPVVAPIVVSAVLLGLIAVFLLILCVRDCSTREKTEQDTARAVPAAPSSAEPGRKVSTTSLRRRGSSQSLTGTVPEKRISPDSAMGSTPSQLYRVSSNSSMGSQGAGRGAPRGVMPRRNENPNTGMNAPNLRRQGSFQGGAMLSRTNSQGSMGSRNGSFRVNMAGLPPPPMPSMTNPYELQQFQQQQMMMMAAAAQGRQSPFIAPMPPQLSPSNMFTPQPAQQFFPPQPGFISSWQQQQQQQSSPPTPQIAPNGAVRRLSQGNLRTDRAIPRSASPHVPPKSPTGSILQKTSSFKRNASSSSIGGAGGGGGSGKNQSQRKSEAQDAAHDMFANPLAECKPRFV